ICRGMSLRWRMCRCSRTRFSGVSAELALLPGPSRSRRRATSCGCSSATSTTT
ncbi:unnamed protein product, partial [Effrenium voratum]